MRSHFVANFVSKRAVPQTPVTHWPKCSVLSLLGLAIVVLPTTGVAQDSTLSANLLDFTNKHCIDCHDGDSGEGGFDAAGLTTDLEDQANFQHWVRVFERVETGEMPPRDSDTIMPTEKQSALSSIQQQLISFQKSQLKREGRVKGRRLTNVQLERTLQDLLCIDIPLSRLMPSESRTNGFVNLADYQAMSHFQLEAHLRVVDAALEESFNRALADRKDWSLDIGPERIASKSGRQRNRDPELREGLAVVWSGGPIYYGRISNARIPHDGWYKIAVTASAIKKPEDRGVWCSIRSGECVSSAPLMNWIGSFELDETPNTWTWEAFISKGHLLEIQPADVTLKRGRFAGGQVGVGEGEPQNIPGLALHRLVIQQIHPGGDIDHVRESLFGEVVRNLSVTTNASATEDIVESLGKLSPEQSEQLLETQMIAFAQRAFRRPVDADAIAPFVQMAKECLRAEDSFISALRLGYRSLLCSPRFLYFVETSDDAGKLDAWSLAARLSYLICGSIPDAELMKAAEQGELDSTEGVRRQVDRLLKTTRGQGFVADFASQWLDLVDIDFTEPDRKLYPDFDVVVQAAMLTETHAFLQHLLDKNLPIRELVGAKYTFLNSRLARYYGIAGVEGDDLQRIELADHDPRGGLLGHGSILKVTANGNDTSPVLRGIWVSERLLGVDIPAPPSNVPAVEPDVRGATTIRELLTKHQADQTCASCHRKIDPPGYALENFDAAGRWRDRYRQLVGGKYKSAAKVDPSCEMPDGGSFESFQEFRDLVASRDESLAKSLAERLLVYGTGAELTFADRPAIQQIVNNTSDSQHAFRSVLYSVIESEPFLNK